MHELSDDIAVIGEPPRRPRHSIGRVPPPRLPAGRPCGYAQRPPRRRRALGSGRRLL